MQRTPLRPVRIHGVPMDLGQNRRGVDMGASAIRYAELQKRLESLGYPVEDWGNLSVPVIEEIEEAADDPRMHNGAVIGQVCRLIYEQMRECLAAEQTAVFLGGDHSMSIGTIAAALERLPRLGVLWIDAHGDFNTPETTPSGNVHGMVVAALMGKCPPVLTIGGARLQPSQIAMIGTRDLDADEKIALAVSGIKIFSMRDIDERGMGSIAREALAWLSDAEALHISLDMDSLDPREAPGVGTPVPGGLTYREAHLLLEILADDGRMRSLDIVEVNPILDNHNQTAEMAVGLAASLFGQRII